MSVAAGKKKKATKYVRGQHAEFSGAVLLLPSGKGGKGENGSAVRNGGHYHKAEREKKKSPVSIWRGNPIYMCQNLGRVKGRGVCDRPAGKRQGRKREGEEYSLTKRIVMLSEKGS